MKEYFRKSDFICLEEITNFPGKSDAVSFFNNLCIETIRALKDYYNHQAQTEHGFQYYEQQVKTYLTISLGKITKNNVIQEYSIERANFQEKDKNIENEANSKGRLDYWAGYKNTDFLIEIKHGWIRYYEKDHFTFYRGLKNRMVTASGQINKITDKKYLHDEKNNLFGLSLIIAPVYGWNVSFKILRFSTENIEYFWKECKKIGANIVGIWKISNDYNKTNKYKKKNGSTLTEDFFSVFFIGKLKKMTKN